MQAGNVNNDTDTCPVCGTKRSRWLGESCSTCLLGLGLPEPAASGPPGDPVDTSRVFAKEVRRTPRWGDYELEKEIARGGMGVVYRARQISLNRWVAVKILIAGRFANETFLERFRREAEAAASLTHPNIVAIHEVGAHDGQPFFAMELVEGCSLAELSRDQPLPSRRAAQLLKTIAEAVQFAHDRGVLHRDLKPSNVLVDAFDVPHITDFGLAKKVEGGGELRVEDGGSGASSPLNSQFHSLSTELTLTGQVLGSPNYMPPEQADPRRGDATPASDVYSLGAILYHLLTGRAPFMAEALAQTLRLVVESDPVSPRLLNPGVPRDLETICLKCLEKESARRYSTARELADELGRCLRDEPIRARRIGAAERLVRWCRRAPALAASLGAGTLLFLIVLIGAPIALLRIDHARTKAEQARARAEAAERATQQQLFAALVDQARATVRSGELGQRIRALDAIRRAAAISNTVALRREVFGALALPDLAFDRALPFPDSYTLRELDPNFERIALCRATEAVEIRAVADQRLLATFPAVTNLASHVAEWSPDGQFLAIKRDQVANGAVADVEVWNVAGARRLLTRREVSWGAMTFHPDEPWLMMAESRSEAAIWDLERGLELRRLQLPGKIQSLRFAPNGGRFAAVHGVGGNWTVSVFDATNGIPLATRSFPGLAIAPVRWHPDGHWLVVPLGNGMVYRMDAGTGELGEIGAHKAEATLANFSPDGDYLLTSGWDRELICYEGRTRRRLYGIRLNSNSAYFRADGGACAVLTSAEIQLHRLARPSALREFSGDIGARLRHAAFSPDGHWLAASTDRCAAVWDLTGRRPPAIDPDGAEAHFFFTTDGVELFGSRSGIRSSAAFRWRLQRPIDLNAAPRMERLPLYQPEDFSFLSVHSNVVIVTGGQGSQIMDRSHLETGPIDWVATASGVNQVSADGRWLAIARPFSPDLYVYRLPGLERVAKLKHPAHISDFEFSPRGDEIAICSRTATEFWSTASWQQTRTTTRLTGYGMVFQNDGQSFWLRRNEQAGLFDTESFESRLVLPDGMLPRALSPDGRLLAVSVEGRRLQVWDLVELRAHFRELKINWTE